MIFAADRPVYFPGCEFWAKMFAAEKFVLADDLQFTRKSGLNRCAIKTVAGAKWLTVPLHIKRATTRKIREVRLNNAQNWGQKHWKSLLVNYKNAAYFEKYDLQLQALFSKKRDFLFDLNLDIILFLKKELGIKTEIFLSSELDVAATGAELNRAWAEKLGASVYLADAGMRPYLERNRAALTELEVKFFKMQELPYYQQFRGFINALSVIDLLFNEGDNAATIIKKMIVPA